MRKTMRRLLIDMDGTVARFYEQAKCIEKMYEPGFFSGLYPYENMIEAVKLLLKRDDLELYFLSSVDGESARADKKNWINMQLGIDVPCMFCNTDRSKAGFVLETLGPITKTDYLLDDYSRNLLEWEEAGGTALKFINELNGRGWNGSNFNGNRIYYDESHEKIAHDLLFWMGMIPNGSPDSPVSQKSFIRAVDEIMTGKLGWYKDMSGWQNEIFACYDDVLSDRTLKKIFSSDDPNMKFFDLIDEWYGQEEADTLEIVESFVLTNKSKDSKFNQKVTTVNKLVLSAREDVLAAVAGQPVTTNSPDKKTTPDTDGKKTTVDANKNKDNSGKNTGKTDGKNGKSTEESPEAEAAKRFTRIVSGIAFLVFLAGIGFHFFLKNKKSNRIASDRLARKEQLRLQAIERQKQLKQNNRPEEMQEEGQEEIQRTDGPTEDTLPPDNPQHAIPRAGEPSASAAAGVAQTRYCQNCGAPLKGNSKFCENCGSKV